MQIIFKAITGSSVTPSRGKESAALYRREQNLSQKPRSWSLPWEVLFALNIICILSKFHTRQRFCSGVACGSLRVIMQCFTTGLVATSV